MAGSVDPEATLPKTEHGQYGMHAGGVTLVAPRRDACTVVRFQDGSLRIGTWSTIARSRRADDVVETRRPPAWWKAASCTRRSVVKARPAGSGARRRNRDPPFGLDASGSILLVALREYTTAGAMAQAMLHAGATDAAQLDVNWSFPRFVVYRKDARNGLVAEGLFPGFVFESDEYVGRRSPRDFFYVLAR